MEALNIEELQKDEICQKWITYLSTEDKKRPTEWYADKQKYWEQNAKYLESKGFSYKQNIGTALDEVSVMKDKDLEGSLLVVKIGNNERPASNEDVNLAHKMLNDVLSDVKGVRVVVTHHAFDIQKISLPQLRSLQSEVLASTDPSLNVNPIIDMDLI